MTGDALRSYDELVAELRRLGLERRTGTLFIATADNESGQIGMRDGLIVHARFRRKTGIEAAYVLRKIGKSRFSFTKDFVEAADPSLSAGAVMAVLMDMEMPVASQGGAETQETARRVLTKALTEYLGPMAAIVVRDQLREAARAGRAPADIVDALAHGIDDPRAAAAFKANASAALAAHAVRRR
jgi:Domain of unknown function (DUF4388)